MTAGNASDASSAQAGEAWTQLELDGEWSELVLPDREIRLLRWICHEFRRRNNARLGGEPQHTDSPAAGLRILFAGQPGTGKTLAAKVIGGELGMDVLRVDLLQMKRVDRAGIQRSLDRALTAAEKANAILMFDAAELLFGTDVAVFRARDGQRHIDAPRLLARIEQHQGPVVLATSLKSRISHELVPRLHFAVDFPFPEVEARRRIWRLLLPGDARVGDADLEFLATSFKLVGSDISRCAVGAATGAWEVGERVDTRHIAHALDVVYGGRRLNSRTEDALEHLHAENRLAEQKAAEAAAAERAAAERAAAERAEAERLAAEQAAAEAAAAERAAAAHAAAERVEADRLAADQAAAEAAAAERAASERAEAERNSGLARELKGNVGSLEQRLDRIDRVVGFHETKAFARLRHLAAEKAAAEAAAAERALAAHAAERAEPEQAAPRTIPKKTRPLTAGSRARTRRPRTGRGHHRRLTLLAISVTITAGLLGLLLGQTLGASGPRALALNGHIATGLVRVSFPSGWKQRAAATPELGLSQELALAPSGHAHGLLLIGTAPTADALLLPKRLLAALTIRPSPTVAVLNGAQYYRYLDLSPRGVPGPVSVYALPTSAGTLLGLCMKQGAGSGFAGVCERVVGTMRPASGSVKALGPSPSYASALNAVIAKLNAASSKAQQRLQKARSARGQAAAATALAKAHNQAASAVARLAGEPAQATSVALVTALRLTGTAYATLARAATRNDTRGYAAARASLSHAEASLKSAFRQLAALGYSVG